MSVPGAPLVDPVDPTEHLSADDMATRQEALFLADALARQQQAARAPREPGRCLNCRQPCLPRAVYCDEECRADHEHRVRTLRRQGAIM